jgi:hypothetical protein
MLTILLAACETTLTLSKRRTTNWTVSSLQIWNG